MEITEKLTAILQILGYTPSKLAKSTKISLHRAKRIFNENAGLNYSEFAEICKLLGAPSLDTFYKRLEEATK